MVRSILRQEQELLRQAEASLERRPLSSCLSREEAQVWVAFHANHIERVRSAPPAEPASRLKLDAKPFGEYFVP